MPIFTAPTKDFEFLLNDFLKVEEHKHLEGFEEVDSSLVSSLLAEGARLCEEVLFPINQSGDAEGCNFKDGKVTLPKGFKEAYQAFVDNGWGSLGGDPDFGGQGLPKMLSVFE